MGMDPRDAFIISPIGNHIDTTTITSVTKLTPPAGASKIMMQAISQNVRFTLQTTTSSEPPTTARGFQLKAGDPPIVVPISKTTTLLVIAEAASPDFNYQWGS